MALRNGSEVEIIQESSETHKSHEICAESLNKKISFLWWDFSEDFSVDPGDEWVENQLRVNNFPSFNWI